MGDERAGEERLTTADKAPHRLTPVRSFVRYSKENLMSYVDGFVLAVPKANIDDYKKLANLAGRYGRNTERSPTSNVPPTTCPMAS